jgi:hypothetical protein
VSSKIQIKPALIRKIIIHVIQLLFFLFCLVGIVSRVCVVANFATFPECVEETHASENVTTVNLKLGKECSMSQDKQEPWSVGWFVDKPYLTWMSKCW